MLARKFFLCLIFILTGCASAPEMPSVKLSSQERIGFLVDVSDFPVHSHGGANPFIRDNHRSYPFDWKLTERIQERFSTKLQQNTQFQAVNLLDYNFSLKDVGRMIGYNKYPIINPEKTHIVERLKKDLNIRTVVVFSSSGNKSMLNSCIPYSCRYTEGITTGLYTRREMLGLGYFSILDVISDIYVLDVPTNLAMSENVKKASKNTIVPLKDFKTPKKITAIKEEEWLPVKGAVESSADHLVDAVVAELENSK